MMVVVIIDYEMDKLYMQITVIKCQEKCQGRRRLVDLNY